MKQKLTSLRLRILLPVIIMTLFVVILLTTMFSHGYTDMLIRQAQRMNAVSFDTVSQSVVPLIDLSIDEVRKIIMDERVRSYARLQYASEADLIHACFLCAATEACSDRFRKGIFFTTIRKIIRLRRL